MLKNAYDQGEGTVYSLSDYQSYSVLILVATIWANQYNTTGSFTISNATTLASSNIGITSSNPNGASAIIFLSGITSSSTYKFSKGNTNPYGITIYGM